MSSLETIKQELLKQKMYLENKGFPVTVTNRNPSPIDISNAINNIDIRFSETTATESDVRAGKTFISKTQGIRTGILDTSNIDVVQDLVNTLISGEGESLDLYQIIPRNISKIRTRAFWVDSNINSNMFYANNFIVPENITYIGEYAFYRVKFSGKLTIPSTCTQVCENAFSYSTMSEVEIRTALKEESYYLFNYCTSLTKATFGPEVRYAPSYMFYNCKTLDEIVIRTSELTWSQYTVYGTNAVSKIIFETSQPITLKSSALSNLKKALLIVPYEYYDTYFNATNYQQYSNPMYGYGDFLTGKILPTTQGLYNLVWYASLDDLQAGTNPVTDCANDGRYYAVCTETETATTT